MPAPLLSIRNLTAAIDGHVILEGLTLDIPAGAIHILIGPNGSGKTTLTRALMGSPEIAVGAEILALDGESLHGLPPEERARKGLYLGFQHPPELPGVTMVSFLRNALLSRNATLPPAEEFTDLLRTAGARFNLGSEMLERNVNEGFSGGERKRNELFQLSLFMPKLAMLDEFDSGLDRDGMRAAADLLTSLVSPTRSLLLITHNIRIGQYVSPDAVHIMIRGRIAVSGGKNLLEKIEKHGFETFSHDLPL